uniref:Uncharacterized protein n=1 Tax=Megaviridae environmental sample TaxID=1737588 RepID=A0A5J6VK12_9VIRU|nr:MAG: hypothetical protein [Megaviridae environmental sample]
MPINCNIFNNIEYKEYKNRRIEKFTTKKINKVLFIYFKNTT